MSEAWAMLVIPAEREGFLGAIANRMSTIGLSLEYPGSESITVLDDEGVQHKWNRDQLATTLSNGGQITLQWWWNDCEDTPFRLRFSDDYAVLEVWLDGHDEQQTRLLLSLLRACYYAAAQGSAVAALIIDYDGTSILYPWIDILLHRRMIPGEFPDLLLATMRAGGHLLRGLGSEVQCESRGGDLLFTRSGSRPDGLDI